MNTTSWPYPLPASRDVDAEARGWRRRATHLAEYFLSWANRRDVWGAYVRQAFRQPDRQNTYTAPGKAKRGAVTLTADILRAHFLAADVGDVIGLHAIGPDGVSRWCGLDFDAHGETTPEFLERLRTAAMWCAEAMGERASVLLEDSNGKGGFHLWVHFAAPVPSDALYLWLRSYAVQCERSTGLKPETYPKQPTLLAEKQFGSWLRLPGRHHTRPHWSRVCLPGEYWRSGVEAVDVIRRHWPATPADAVPPVDAWPTVVQAAAQPAPVVLPSTIPNNRAERIARYVDRLPHGTAGTGRSDCLYRLACFLRFDMACSDAEALPVLHAWNAGNNPPLSARKVVETWQNAHTYGGRARAA